MVSGLHFYLRLSSFFHTTTRTVMETLEAATGSGAWRSHRSDHWPSPPPETQLPLSVGSTLTHCGQAWASKRVCEENEATEHVFITLKNFTAEELNWIRPCAVYWQSKISNRVCLRGWTIYTLRNKSKIHSWEETEEKQTCGDPVWIREQPHRKCISCA